MRTRLPRDSGETNGGLQRRRLAGRREETFLFRVPCSLQDCSGASSFRPRHPPPTTTAASWEGLPPARPSLRPGTRLVPVLGAANVTVRVRGNGAAISNPSSLQASYGASPRPKQGTREPPSSHHHDKVKAFKRQDAGECACVCSKHLNPRHAVGRRRHAAHHTTAAERPSVRKEKK